jgi:hypothetical protein
MNCLMPMQVCFVHSHFAIMWCKQRLNNCIKLSQYTQAVSVREAEQYSCTNSKICHILLKMQKPFILTCNRFIMYSVANDVIFNLYKRIVPLVMEKRDVCINN